MEQPKKKKITPESAIDQPAEVERIDHFAAILTELRAIRRALEHPKETAINELQGKS